MAVTMRAEVLLSARNGIRPGLASAARDLERFRQMQSKAALGARAEEMATRAGGMLRGAVAGIAAGGILNTVSQANKRFADVDRTMSRIGITGDATTEQTREGTSALRDMAREAALPFDQVREGMDAIAASGREFGDALKMMPSVTRTAQASGASVSDIANSTTSLIDHMKISIEGLQLAQDTLAKGGQLGKFELKDMARYLPSMLPAFKAIGYEGQQGLEKLVAILQVIRAGTGTAEEAAASANNIFAKMESEATVKNFKDMGVDLPKAFAKARKEGKDLLSVFTDLTEKALKGDMSKLPQLFNDMEFARGMRALLAGKAMRERIQKELADSAGTVAAGLKRITGDAQASIDRFTEATDRAKTAFGSLASNIASPSLEQGASNIDKIAQSLERAAKVIRDKGVGEGVKSIASGAVQAIVDEAAQGRADLAAAGIEGQDDRTLAAIEARRKAGAADGKAVEVQKTLDYLADLPQTPARREQIAKMRADLESRSKDSPGSVMLTPEEWAAFSRDQMRRQGASQDPTGYAPLEAPKDIAEITDTAREDRRNQAFRALTQGKQAAKPVAKPPRTVTAPMPPEHPGRATVPVAPLDDTAPATATKPATAQATPVDATGISAALKQAQDFKALLDQPIAATVTLDAEPLEAAKAKTGDVKTAVEGLGPAGQQAGGQMAAGFLAGLLQMEAQADATIARIQGKLNTLRSPSLSFGGGGGFNTGRAMGEVQ